MAQILIRFAAVCLMTFLCSQSFAGVIPGNIAVTPFGTPTSRVQLTGTPVSNSLTLSSISVSQSSLEFNGILASQSIPTGTISVSNVMTDGNASLDFGELSQPTTSGDFSLSDPDDNLLLSGTFGAGLISGPTNDITAGFNTDQVMFNGGSLLQFIKPEGSFVLSLIVDGGSLEQTTAGTLAPFSADITANITVQGIHPDGQVPEPGSIFIFAPMLLGLVSRRRVAS